jgi:hypothetical protein
MTGVPLIDRSKFRNPLATHLRVASVFRSGRNTDPGQEVRLSVVGYDGAKRV